jgi:hypothetical protein
MRLVVTLSVAAAVTVMVGAVLVILGTVIRLVTKHPASGMTHLGLDVGAAGIAFGLIVLLVFAFARRGADRRAASRRRSAGRQQHAATAGEHGHAGRDTATRSARSHVLNPTGVYSPGGLLDIPGEARAPRHPAQGTWGSSGTWESPGTREN